MLTASKANARVPRRFLLSGSGAGGAGPGQPGLSEAKMLREREGLAPQSPLLPGLHRQTMHREDGDPWQMQPRFVQGQ